MAAYLRFYQFNSSPFDGSVAKRGMVLGTQSLRGALGRVKHALEEDAPRICLSGSEGVGKTSLCRALPKLLAQEALVAVVIDPRRSWEDIRARVAKKFGIEGTALSRKSLMGARQEGKRLVVVIDRAELLSHEVLDHLDILLQYKDDHGGQLLHCVMLANLEAAASGAETPLLWWLDKFTTLQLQFSPIPVEGVRHYVEKHLAKAGWAGGQLFTPEALRAIHSNTGGIPGAINKLCERILIEGGIRAITSISEDFIEELCGGAPSATNPRDGMDSAELSADLSFGDFGTSPTAQEMLDDPCAQPTLGNEEEEKERESQQIGDVADIASLLVTQDSPEPLRTVSDETQTNDDRDTSAIELEEEPHETKYADFYESNHTSIPSSASVNRSASTASSRGGRHGGMIVGLVALAAIGWYMHSRLSVPTKLIETAEEKIEEVLEKAPKITLMTKVTPEAAEVEDLEEDESGLPPSLLDRADELVADPTADLIPVPQIDSAAVAVVEETNDNSELAEATRPPAEEALDGPDSRKQAEEEVAAAPEAPADKAPRPSATVERQSSEIPSEMLVINEYTAIPQAAETAPKLALPVDDDEDELEAVAQNSEPGALGESLPARLAPNAETQPTPPAGGTVETP